MKILISQTNILRLKRVAVERSIYLQNVLFFYQGEQKGNTSLILALFLNFE